MISGLGISQRGYWVSGSQFRVSVWGVLFRVYGSDFQVIG
jgi:hypothetical protein